jgi:hypothetical protein
MTPIVGSQFRMFGIVHTCCFASYHSHGPWLVVSSSWQGEILGVNDRHTWDWDWPARIMKLFWWYLHQLGPQILHLKSPEVLGLILSSNLLSLQLKGQVGAGGGFTNTMSHSRKWGGKGGSVPNKIGHLQSGTLLVSTKMCQILILDL